MKFGAPYLIFNQNQTLSCRKKIFARFRCRILTSRLRHYYHVFTKNSCNRHISWGNEENSMGNLWLAGCERSAWRGWIAKWDVLTKLVPTLAEVFHHESTGSQMRSWDKILYPLWQRLLTMNQLERWRKRMSEQLNHCDKKEWYGQRNWWNGSLLYQYQRGKKMSMG